MTLERDLYMKLLEAPEYAEMLAFPVGGGSMSLVWDRVPKRHYLPLCGDYVDGFILCGRLNDAVAAGELNNGLLRITLSH